MTEVPNETIRNLQLPVPFVEWTSRFVASPAEVYGERWVTENPDAIEAAQQFCWHRPFWPCSECVGYAMLAIVPLKVRLDRTEEAGKRLSEAIIEAMYGMSESVRIQAEEALLAWQNR